MRLISCIRDSKVITLETTLNEILGRIPVKTIYNDRKNRTT